MRIHTNAIPNRLVIIDALKAEKESGRIASHVSFKTLCEHGSRSHTHAYEIQLEAAMRDNGRRAGNSGSYGAMRPEYDGYTATYDEWGWLLAALYRLDPDMQVGTGAYPVYADREDFDFKTAWTYNPERWLEFVNEWPTFADDRDPFPYVTGQASKTKRGYLIGRRGANREHIDNNYAARHGKYQPRTVEEVRAFAYPHLMSP